MFTELVRRLDVLATPNGIDRFVELVAPTFSTTEIRAKVTQVNHQTPDSVTLTLAPNALWDGFRAGQHVALSVEIDGVRHTRCYSMANSATDADVIELTVKAHPEGLVSRHLVAHARPGMVVALSPAQGDFVLPEVIDSPLVLMSGGSGVTPVMAMLRTLCATGHTGAVTWIHYALTADDHLYRDEVSTLAANHPNVEVRTVYTDAPGTGDADGFFSAAQLDALAPGWAEARAFVCGPAPLMSGVREHYGAVGLADRVHDEAFTLPAFVAEAGSTGATIHFADSDVTIADDGRTLLDQAEAAGVNPASGCRMGICQTCTRSLTCGTVRNVVTGAVTSEPGTEVHLCTSTAVGDVAVSL